MKISDKAIVSDLQKKSLFNKRILILGSIFSILLLIISFVFENAVLILLDGLIPTVFILYVYFFKKQLPLYCYLICSCGIYTLLWNILYFPDFKPENAVKSKIYSLSSVINAMGEITTVGIFFIAITPLLLLIAPKIEKYIARNTIKKFIQKTKLSFLSVFIIVAILIFTMFCSLNVVLDESYKESFVYVVGKMDRVNIVHKNPDNSGMGGIFCYKYLLDSEDEYYIEYNNIFYEPKNFDENGNQMIKIQYGKGAFGLEWRRIIE